MSSPASRPFDLDAVRETAWPAHLMPEGEGDRFDKEPFEAWWPRVQGELGHLPPRLCEQWIHRHWLGSPFRFLPLQTLSWREVTMTGEALMAGVQRAWGGGLDAAFDYATFQRRGGDDRHPTARALDDGTWDYPMVLLSTPAGIHIEGRDHADARLVIVEGHQRHRYLAALHALGRPPAGPHSVYILSSPIVGGALPLASTATIEEDAAREGQP